METKFNGLDSSIGEESELYLDLKDREWPLEYIDHDRRIARAVVLIFGHDPSSIVNR